jgi:hypothetical protein
MHLEKWQRKIITLRDEKLNKGLSAGEMTWQLTPTNTIPKFLGENYPKLLTLVCHAWTVLELKYDPTQMEGGGTWPINCVKWRLIFACSQYTFHSPGVCNFEVILPPGFSEILCPPDQHASFSYSLLDKSWENWLTGVICSTYCKLPGSRIITKKLLGSSRSNKSIVVVSAGTWVNQQGICTVQEAGDGGTGIDVKSEK